MGSGASRLLACVRCSPSSSSSSSPSPPPPPPLDETLGHSFCYLRSSSLPLINADTSSSFFAISGASVSANSSVPVPIHASSDSFLPASHFHSSASFSALPLQVAPGNLTETDRGCFMSGPIERGAMSGPLDAVPFSGSLVVGEKQRLKSISKRFRRRRPASFSLKRSASEKNQYRPWVVPIPNGAGSGAGAVTNEIGGELEGVQWAHGKAGEDRVHVVISEEHGWLFVGIYDGFNGPDAPDFLVSHLYQSLHAHLRGLFWEEGEREEEGGKGGDEMKCEKIVGRQLWQYLEEEQCGLEFSGAGRFAFSLSKIRRRRKMSKSKEEILMPTPTKEGRITKRLVPISDHSTVLNALAQALESTENLYLEMGDKLMDSNPELALMGSCLLVALIRDDDVYVMNVGDSRAIIAQCAGNDGNGDYGEMEGTDKEGAGLVAVQLSTDHSTSIEEEVLRIKREHPDDDKCIVNDRVKGRLKVTRAFGAGYLKQAKWNNGLLEMFRNEFIGTAPYVICTPSLCHYKLGQNDQFLVLSSDGLYQYFSNEEVVSHVESFMQRFPDGDPAQSLLEELLFRAAKKAGMDFYELLDIPQGDRRKYHDDVTVIVISLEGRIWKSSGRYL